MTVEVFDAMECAVARAHREERRKAARAGMWERIQFYVIAGAAAYPFVMVGAALLARWRLGQ